jgi:hypothetical protein
MRIAVTCTIPASVKGEDNSQEFTGKDANSVYGGDLENETMAAIMMQAIRTAYSAGHEAGAKRGLTAGYAACRDAVREAVSSAGLPRFDIACNVED